MKFRSDGVVFCVAIEIITYSATSTVSFGYEISVVSTKIPIEFEPSFFVICKVINRGFVGNVSGTLFSGQSS